MGHARIWKIALALAAAATGQLLAQQGVPPAYPFNDQRLSIPERVRDLVSRLTLEEKSRQMVNSAPAVPRLGIPAYDYWSEGLHGIARSGYATLFPQAIGNAATFDAPLLHRIGEAVSTEARGKFNDAVAHGNRSIFYGLTIWSPNINIFRDPRWGRGQETYGEDPFLTGTLGTAFVTGIQGADPQVYRAIGTPKHFAVHSGPESTRHSADVDPTPHDLEDTYLPAFRRTVVEGRAASLMCAYNRVDGVPACANKPLLEDTLRHSWSFSGFVTSDCGAVDDFFSKNGHHTAKTAEEAAALAVEAGTDTNCGDTYLALPIAVRQKLVSEAEIDTALTRLFTARMRLGLFDTPAGGSAYSRLGLRDVLTPEHRALALQAARESMVLLKNEHGTLPLAVGGPHVRFQKRIAVVGPGATDLFALTGNYYAIPQEPELPLDALMKTGAAVRYAQGAPYADGARMVVPRTELHAEPVHMGPPGTRIGMPLPSGLTGSYYANDRFAGEPALTRIDREIEFDWTGAQPAPVIPANVFSVRWRGSLSAPTAGDYRYSIRLTECYPCRDYESVRVTVDGTELLNFVSDSTETDFRQKAVQDFTVHFNGTEAKPVVIEYVHRSERFGAGLSFQWRPPAAALRAQAVEAAQSSDAVIAFVGLNPTLEGEEMPVKIPGFAGGDRTDIGLPGAQQQMLEALKKTGKPLVVVLMNGSALAVNWAAEHADAILEAWYPGEAGGAAIAETITGKNNPAGRLPVTFYKDVHDLPPFDDYSMANRTYRYFSGTPLYGFGYGLSYTTFGYTNVRVNHPKLRAGESLTLEADVKNTGTLEGDEVAELYLLPPQGSGNPHLALAGFQRVHLAAGASRHLRFTVDARSLSLVDEQGHRAVRPGTYRVAVGGAQPAADDAGLRSFTVTGTAGLPR